MFRYAVEILHRKCMEEAGKALGIRDKLLTSFICDMAIDVSLAIIISSLLCRRDSREEDIWEEMSNYWGE